MTKNYTPNLKLLSESDDEIIDQFNINWPLLDTAAGPTSIAADYIPPVGELYNGKMFYEPTTGKYWIAGLNPSTGVLERKWLIYPWSCIATTSSPTFINGYGSNSFGFDAASGVNFIPNEQLNGAKQIVAPVDGIYSINLLVRFLANVTGTRSLFIRYNELTNEYQDTNNVKMALSVGPTNVECVDHKLLKAGDRVDGAAWQDSGITLGINDAHLTMELITPL